VEVRFWQQKTYARGPGTPTGLQDPLCGYVDFMANTCEVPQQPFGAIGSGLQAATLQQQDFGPAAKQLGNKYKQMSAAQTDIESVLQNDHTSAPQHKAWA
jgi:hypothetical protein